MKTLEEVFTSLILTWPCLALEDKIELGQKEGDDWKNLKETAAFGLLGGPDIALPRTGGHIDVVRIDYCGKPM